MRRCCKPARTQKLLDNGDDKISKHLVITKLLKRTLISDDFVKESLNAKKDKQIKQMIKYNKNFRINDTTSSSSSSSSEENPGGTREAKQIKRRRSDPRKGTTRLQFITKRFNRTMRSKKK